MSTVMYCLLLCRNIVIVCSRTAIYLICILFFSRFFFCVYYFFVFFFFFFFQAEDGIRDWSVTGVQTCALPIFYFIHKLSLFTNFIHSCHLFYTQISIRNYNLKISLTLFIYLVQFSFSHS